MSETGICLACGLYKCEDVEACEASLRPRGAAKKLAPEKSLAENFVAFAARMSTKWDYGSVETLPNGDLVLASSWGTGSEWKEIRIPGDKVKGFLLPFLRGAYGTSLRPAEVEAFEKLTGGKA